MRKVCICGGKMIRNDIKAEYSPIYKRVLYTDMSTLVATWECSNCHTTYTQRKRQPAKKKAL